MLDRKIILDILPLTPMQEGMLFHFLKEPESNLYLEQLSLTVSGNLEIKLCKKAWNAVIDANEMLRAAFRWEKLENPVLIILKEFQLQPLYYDLTDINPNNTNNQLDTIKLNDRETKFDLHEVPFRVTLCKTGKDHFEMIISYHHILFDGWSTGIILEEFFTVYNALAMGKEWLKPVKTGFKEFVKRYHTPSAGPDITGQEYFWKNYLAGIESPTELSLKKSWKTNGFIRHTGTALLTFVNDEKKDLDSFIKNHKITLASLFYCAWGILLQKYNNCDDVIFGTTTAGRPSSIPGIEKMVGLFINTIPLRIFMNLNESIPALLSRTEAALQTREKFEHSSLADIKKYSGRTRNEELFDSIIVIENYPLDNRLMLKNGKLKVDSYSLQERTHYDLTIQVKILSDVEVNVSYNRDSLDEETVSRLCIHFKSLVLDMLKNPGKKIFEIDILREEEKKQLLYDFNNTTADYPDDKTIHQLFVEQATRTPDNIAVVGTVCPDASGGKGAFLKNRPLDPQKTFIYLTYRELNDQSDRLAGILIEKGVLADTTVGIMMGRCIEMIIGIMGILKAGGAYLPISPDLPDERIQYMLEDSNTKILLATEECQKEIIINCNLKNLPKAPFHHSSFILNGRPRRGLHHSRHLAYIIYTSGTTGKPKGVIIEHRSVVNRLHWMQKTFPISGKGVLVQKTSFMFDVSVWEIFWWSFTGASLFLLGPGEEKNPGNIIHAVERFCVTVIHFVPPMLSAFLDYVETNLLFSKLAHLKNVFASGEALTSRQVIDFNRLLKQSNGTGLINLYGPTEATVDVSYFNCPVGEVPGNIPIGKPIDNIQFYIVDRVIQLQPIGVPGELCISGVGLARGYLNRPELTAERFCFVKSFSGGAGGRFYKKAPLVLYKTGDQARCLYDGNIEFLGRIDRQVKIRGFRIELEEIEAQLLAHEDIKEAVVITMIDETGDHYLCAYWTPQRKVEVLSLKEYLAERLPDYMIPPYFVKLERLPLTPTGKIDRKALPIPEVKSRQKYIAPRDRVEKKLTEIWAGVLFGKDAAHAAHTPIGMEDNFFDLGGHSIKAMLLAARVQKEFAVDFPLGQVLKMPRVSALADFIKSATSDIYMDIPVKEKKEYYPLSSAQKRLFFLDRFEHIGISYNMPFVLKIMGKPDKERFESAFRQLIRRHETLRTSFAFFPNQPVQRVHDADDVDFEIREIETLEGDRSNITGIIDGFVQRFDLAQSPLLRVGLVRLAVDETMLLFDMHHIISDGTSTGILIDEFTRLYAGEKLSPMEIQYRDFASWQNDRSQIDETGKQEEFWLNLFSGDIPHLALHADYPRPGTFTFEGDRLGFGLGGNYIAGLREICTRNETTFFMSLMAVFNILLYKYSGDEDIVVGTVTAGRLHQALQGSIGMFVNTLAMRNSPVGTKTFLAFLYEVKAMGIQAFENQDLQFEALVDKLSVERDASRNPIFDVCFAMQNFERKEIKLPGLTLSPYDYAPKISQFDLTLEAWELGDDIVFYLEYYTRIFERKTVERFSRHFLTVIEQICRSPNIFISAIDIISEEEKRLIALEFNNTTVFYPTDKTVPKLFEERVQVSPDAAAVASENHYLTYGELDRRAGELAGYLSDEIGIRPEDRVGIMIDMCADGVIGIMGILKAGGAYVPVAHFVPEERIKGIIKDAGIGVVCSRQKYLRKLDRFLWECADLHTYLCLDTPDIYPGDDVEESELLHLKNLWNYIGETAVDEITGGGWVSSYTGEPFSKKEMEEYGDNVLQKLAPLLNKKMKVLEIGCASGITMFRVAPRVGSYYGTDLSTVIIEKNTRRVEEEKHKNIRLAVLAAHEIDQVREKDFDLVIINSVIQDFYGLNYLRGVILKTLDLMANGAYFFFGDIMDLDMKDELIREMVEFKREHREQGYRTKTDFSGDLFISRDFFRDLRRDIPALQEPEFSSKIHTVENELTKFRYDILVKINKNTPLLITPNKRFFGVRSGGARKPLRSISPGPGWRSANSSTSPGADSLAYIMYTSGSTGRPKGVMVEHRGVVNLIHWFARTFDIRPGIHLLQLTGYSFDPSVEDIFTTLAYGATLYVGSVDLNVNRDEFKKYVDRNQVHIVDFVPSALGFLLGGEEKFKSLQVVISGGERLEDSVKDRLIARGYRLYNNYGPTEVTVDALSSECSGDRVFLGKPIANTRCYVLDKDDRLSAIGIKGELCIAGAGISRGYLNDPELSGEKFRKDLVKGERIYRTGDVVRHSPGGKIEFIGRKDNQVKIRGYRIEPGGIEKRIREIEDIEDVVVVDREKSPGNKYLCAYFVSRKDMDVTDLKNSLAKIIPDYMMPLYFMQLKKMPRKVTGKIDEKALPVPVGGHGTEAYVAPRDELEAKLAAAWADVLGMEPERIGIDDNFFELGGHSLKAAVLTAKIHRELHIKVPLAEIFQLPVIRGLAGYIKQAAKDIYTAIEVAEKKEYYLLSSAQKRMYVLQQMEDQGTGYNIPAVLLLEGQVNKQKLEDTFKCLLQRHESLRTSFEMAAGEPVQRIHDEVEFEIEQLGAKGLELGVINEKNSSKVFGPTFFQKGGFIRPFDLSCAPLLRVALRKLEKTTHLLMIDMHHIIADGVSIEVLIKEFSTIYRGGEPGALRIQYKDFSEWQNRLKAIGMFQHQEEYWRNELAGEAPKLFLPTDFPRPTVWSFAGNILEFEIGEKETARLNTLTGAANTTLFMTLLATFNVLLSKICGQEEIVVGTPVSGRGHADLENIMGMFVNTLVLRTHPVGEKSFLSFLKETRHKTLQALENQDYPFEELVQKVPVERNVSRNPLVDVMFTLQNYFAVSYDSLNQEIEGLTIKSCGYENKTAKFDLLLSAVEKEGKLVFSFEYSTQLFKEETLARFAVCFKSVIWQLTRKPRVNILNIEILSEEERAMILNDFNNTAADYPRDQKIHEIFKDQASKTPDRIALSGESVRPVGHFRLGRHIIPINLTYRQLNEQSDQLAALLIEKGLLAGDIVGIMLERSVELIIGIIGILKSGAAYMPIDPEYPEERIQYMLADSNARILLETEESQKKIIINCQLLIVNCKLKNLPKAPLHHSSFIIYHLNHLAYIMYTSGSTGEPKGVMVTHRNVVRLVKNANFVPLTEETRILQTGAPVFDASTFEIWGSLLNGGQLILAHKEVILDARRLGDALKVNRVNTLWLSAPLFHQLVQQDLGLFSILHYLLVGGDTLNPGYINRVRRQFPYLKIINGYGPTENTTFSTTYFIEKEFAYNIPIGRPIANSTAYIYDKDSHLAPIGVWGELYVGGDGVAMGYLNNPELTSKRFNRSYKTYINYKTGDLCRWLSDGSIEFLGRLDQQVKIRGFRVELAEIENRLRKHDQVKEAVVLDRKISDEKYLCAYIVPGPVSTPVAAELRAYLSRSLPEYMIPTFFEFIEKIPLNPNGKIDRKALPEPGAIAKAKEYTAPRDEIEKKLAALWEVILKPQLPIGIDDNFFDLGGHSLNATVLTTRIYKTLGVKIPLKEFFQRGSIREVAEYIKGVKKEKFVGIEPLERKEYYASSSAQRRLYFLQQLVGDNIVYNMPAAVILEGVVDKDRLQTAFKKLILRHESFRTSFEMIGTEAVQKIHEDVLFEIEYKNSSIDYTDYTDEKDYIQHFIQPFDLSSAPLMRVSVVKEEEEKHLLMVDMHHIISDGVSQGILIRDFMRLYEGKELFPLKLQYKDYAEWQSNEREPETVKQQKEFWLNEFAGEVPVLEIPTDFPRPVIQSFDGMALDFKLENNAIEALKALAKEEGATLFMVLLSLYTILLAKLSSREDIVVGTPTAGRQHADFEKIIGMFVNTLAMRNFSHGEMSFKQFLKEVKERTLAAFAQQDYPYDELVEMLAIERDTSRNPLFDAMLALQNMDIPSMEIPGLKLKPFNFMNMIAKFDLTLIIFEMGNDLSCTLEYCTKLFKQETIDRFIGYFKNIVSHVIDIPGTKIAGIDILSGQEKKRLLVEFSETGVVYPAEKTLHELFENQVEKTPDSVALVGADLRVCPVCLTFFQLNEQSNRLAGLLIEKGVRTDSIVGIMMKRSIDLIIGIIGILKCGAAYLPIDPNSPEERVQYMLADSNVRILLETEESQKKIIVNCQLLIINCKLKNLPKAPLHHSPLILNGCPRRGLHHSNHQAYIIYTSGSTGKPKAVPITHANVSPLLHWGYEHLGIAPGDRALQNLSYYFDWSVWEIFITLTTGATLYIAPEDILLNPEACGRFIITNKITVLHATPTQYSFLVNLSQRFETLQYLFIGAEKFTFELLAGCFASVTNQCRIFNMYGPTEATIIAAVLEIQREFKNPSLSSVPIGKPAANNQLLILDRHLQLCPIHAYGELFVGGCGVAMGYLNNPELTAERFIMPSATRGTFEKVPLDPSKLLSIHNLPLYKTGDLARWLNDGNIEFLGRIDHQVKIRGMRIEPGEIETKLLSYNGITEAVVVSIEDCEKKNTYLSAYFTTTKRSPIKTSELRTFLSHELPDYMIPTYFTQIERLPLNANGKLDRRALPIPTGFETAPTYETPRDIVEEKLAEIWSEVLGIKKNLISIDANFFESGGHSLKAAVLLSKIHRDLHSKMALVDVFTRPTIRELAEYVKNTEENRFISIKPTAKKEYYSLSSAQKRMYFLKQLLEDNTVYNIPTTVILEGVIDKDRLQVTFKKLIERHESFRTTFEMVGPEPMQIIHDDVQFEIEYKNSSTDYTDYTDEKDYIQHFIQPFDLSRAPLMRVSLVKKEDEKHLLIVDMHHIISDGVSQGILIREFMRLYEGKELAPLKLQYIDYAEWQNSEKEHEAVKQQREFWLNEFAGDVPVLEIPTDYPRPGIQSFEGMAVDFTIENNETEVLKALAKEEGVTLFMVLLSLYTILLAKLSSREDIIVGTPTAGRGHADLEKIIGMFVNTLALRNFPHGEMSFKQFLNEIKERTLAAFAQQDYPYDELVEALDTWRDMGRNPLFDTMLALQNMDTPTVEIPGLSLKPFDFKNNIARFDLTLIVSEIDDTLLFTFEYCTRLFKQETIERFFEFFKKIIKIVSADPVIAIAKIEIIPEEEKRRVLFEFNGAFAEFPQDKTIHELFRDQASKTPDHIALVGADLRVCPASLTYGQLNKQSDQLAEVLIEKGVLADGIVAIMMERSIEMIIGIMGILKAGGAYLPIDPEYPQERIDYMLKDSNAQVVVDEKFFGGSRAPRRGGPIGVFQKSPPASLNLAYIIYTSGTTGKPKGVLIEHRNVVQLLFNDKFQFDFNEQDTWTMFHSYCFDFSVWEMYGALLYGGKLVLILKTTARDMKHYLELLKSSCVTVLNQTPSAFYMLAEEELKSSGKMLRLRYVIFGGEALWPGRLKEWYDKYPGTKLVNMFGITETTVHVTYKEIGVEEIRLNKSNIGKPLPTLNTYIMDKYSLLVPIGTAGELGVGGYGTARGYLNRPELTEERFLLNKSFAGVQGGLFQKPPLVLYKSGDLGRFSANGELEYLGRIDQQVKIRGFRIELGEIEAQLTRHENIKESVVIARTDHSGDLYLCAYVVFHNDINTKTDADLREYLSRRLPDYMIPAYFIFIDKIPLTLNGKLDLQHLPEPGEPSGIIASGISYKAPRNEVENQMTDVFARILELEHPGIRNNFFTNGGDSIKAVRFIGLLNERLQANLKIKDLYAHPTVEELAGLIQQDRGGDPVAERIEVEKQIETLKQQIMAEGNFHGSEIEDIYPMSDIEKGLVFYYSKSTGTAVYHDQFIYPLKYREFDADVYNRALELIVEKHPILRTGFNVEDFGESVQIVYRHVPVDLPHYDITHLDRPEQGAYIKNYLAEDRQHPFDAAVPPLVRISVFISDNENIHVALVFHHAVLDGWSAASLMTELHNTYLRLKVNPQLLLAKLKCSYRDVIVEEIMEKSREENRRFWLLELHDYKRLEFPRVLENPRPGPFTGMRTHVHHLGNDLLALLKKTAEDYGTSLKDLCFGAYVYVLAMLCNECDITAGSVTHNRPQKQDGDKLLGCFLNTVPVRVAIPPGVNWLDYFNMVAAKMLEIKKYERVSLFEIARVIGEKSQDQNPIFDTLFNFVDFHVYFDADAGTVDLNDMETGAFSTESNQDTNTLFDFEISITFGEFILCPKYNYLAISGEMVQRSCVYFERILKKFIYEPHVIARKSDILPEEEKRKIVEEFNDTIVLYDRDSILPGLFEDQVEKTPDYMAVTGDAPDGLKHLTYNELDKRANRLAQALREKGVKPECLVGVVIDRSFEMIIAVMAILKAGGAYVPLEPYLPDTRIKKLLESLDVKFLVTGDLQLSRVGVIAEELPALRHIFCLPSALADEDMPEQLPSLSVSGDIAYIVFTSGSTGIPKGVVMRRRPVVNVIRWVNNTFQVGPGDKLLFISSLGFDLSVYDIFGTLASGACIRLAVAEDLKEPWRLLDIILEEGITFWDSAPAALQQLAPFFSEIKNSIHKSRLRLVFLSGDWIPITLPDVLKETFSGVNVISLGGATEAAIWSNYYPIGKVDPGWVSIPYGKPIQNAQYYILDPSLDICPLMVPGDLYIGGDCLASGYINDIELTSEKFCQIKSFAGVKGGLFQKPPLVLYRTGDMARWFLDPAARGAYIAAREGGAYIMEFLGRKDQQVKIRGFRIELGEIESQLRHHDEIDDAVVIAMGEKAADKFLCAYFVSEKSLESSALGKYLAAELPDYMIPRYFIQVERIPLTANGKVDRKALPVPGETEMGASYVPYVAPRNEIEEKLAAIWSDVLAKNDSASIGIDDDFFELGGHSLNAAIVISKIHKILNVKIPLAELFHKPTIRQLSGVIRSINEETDQAKLELLKSEKNSKIV